MTRLLLACLLLLLGHPAHAFPRAFEATYTLGTSGLTLGETAQSLAPEDKGLYRFRSESRSTGPLSLLVNERIEETSLFLYREGNIQPLEYRYQRRGRKPRTWKVLFHWDRGIAEIWGEKKRTLTIPPGSLDRLSFQIALMQDLEKGKRTFAYSVVDRKKVRRYRFRVTGQETLELPMGPVRALRIEKEGSGKRKTVFWCAPTLAYLPVRIAYTEKDGRRFLSVLKSAVFQK